MSSSSSASSSDDSKHYYYGNGICSSSATSQNKYKGIRRRKWGKWVSEIRVPGTTERLWLGSYTTPEAAAVAHDVALYCLKGNSSPERFNFPLMLPSSAKIGMSPAEVQKAASDAGLAIDARLLNSKNAETTLKNLNEKGKMLTNDLVGEEIWENGRWDWPRSASECKEENLSISVDDYL